MNITAKLVQTIIGFVLFATGAFCMFHQNLSPEKEDASDFFAISGLVLMIIGVVLLFSLLIR